jgi:predicted deacylase
MQGVQEVQGVQGVQGVQEVPRVRERAGVVGAVMAIATLAYATGALAQDPHPTFTVGTATASRGAMATGVIHVPAGVDAGYDIPVAVVHGARPGPVLAVVSGAHGTEYASIVAVEMLMAGPPVPAVDPSTLSGTLILVPLVNVNSFEKITPHVNPVDNKSMNRFYPGSTSGTQTERASYAITKEVVEKCDHLIDLHGGDLDENLRPYSYWTVTGNQKQDEFSKGMVLAFGLDHIIISADRPRDPNASRFLENTASTRGKPSFTAEAGRSGPVESGDAGVLVKGVRGVMAYLKMTTAAPVPNPNPVWVDRIVSVASEHDGMFYPAVARNARVVKGARVGVIRDYWYKTIAEVTAPEAGIVMFVRALPSLKKGDTIVNIGTIKPAGK